MKSLLMLPSEVLEPILEHVLSVQPEIQVWAAEMHLWHNSKRVQYDLVEVQDDSQLSQRIFDLDLALLRTNFRISSNLKTTA
ncbi:hypothetical protein KVT40_006232 [Elsinoe batatas]|uniref:Uncharacterized protein n=1 Tax=Elsinoe batatas TaxID=2601811 RepID=A0A8K0PDL2_9PEZI|nr:hypothetical protein KVT40_006232 [Elsinoe batatas]